MTFFRTVLKMNAILKFFFHPVSSKLLDMTKLQLPMFGHQIDILRIR